MIVVSATNYVLPESGRDRSIRLNSLGDGNVQTGNTKAYLRLNVQSDHPAFPKIRERKIMGIDIQAAKTALYDLILENQLESTHLNHCGSFIINSLRVSDIEEEMTDLADQAISAQSQTKKIDRDGAAKLYKMMHPLFGLKTLANAPQSFFSESFGIKGENCTFGGTSAGGYNGLKSAFESIRSGRTERAIVGAMNACGNTNTGVNRFHIDQELAAPEAEGCCFILLETLEACLNRGAAPLASLELFEQKNVGSYAQKRSPDELQLNNLQSCPEVIASSPFVSSVLPASETTQSWVTSYGNLGTVNMLLNVCAAIQTLNSSKKGCNENRVSCVDLDPLGRLSHLVVGGIK